MNDAEKLTDAAKERIKYRATFYNALSTLFMALGIIGPTVGLVLDQTGTGQGSPGLFFAVLAISTVAAILFQIAVWFELGKLDDKSGGGRK